MTTYLLSKLSHRHYKLPEQNDVQRSWGFAEILGGCCIGHHVYDDNQRIDLSQRNGRKEGENPVSSCFACYVGSLYNEESNMQNIEDIKSVLNL